MLRRFVWTCFLTVCAAANGGATLLPSSGGLVVYIGCDAAELASPLDLGKNVLVHGLDTDPAKVAAARESLRERGVYGRVTVDVFDGKHLPYVDNMVNLVDASRGTTVPEAEILRVLVPHAAAVVGTARKLVKPWPKDMDEWTHWLHGPDQNAVSRDRLVGVSRHLQWIAGPLWARHHNLLPSVSAMVSAKGRLFTIIDTAPINVRGGPDRWVLEARDAFNGLPLWTRPMKKWGWKEWSEVEVAGLMRFKGPSQLFRRLVAAGDLVYVTLGFDAPVTALEAPTGKTVRTYEGTGNASEILFYERLLVLAKNEGEGKSILAVNSETGRILWEKEGFKGVTAHGDELKRFTDAYLTVGGDGVFFLDGDHVVCLDIKDGSEEWRIERPVVKKAIFGHYQYNHANLCTLVHSDGRLFLGQMDPFPDNLNKRQEKAMTILALDAKSGRKLWEHRGATFAHFTPPDLFVNHGLVWTFKQKEVALVGLDAATGEVKKEYPAKSILIGHHARCYRNKATERFYLAGEEGIEYIDFDSGKIDVHHWMRGACRYGILPANGLITLPSHSCGCHANAKLNGFLALASKSVPEIDAPAERLTRGPAYPSLGNRKSALRRGSGQAIGNPEDWPMYRHDIRRSGRASTIVPLKLVKQWDAEIGGRPTAPIIAGGTVFVAVRDANQIIALDAATGKPRWQFIADGPVDTPPTWHKGRVVFGSRGGSVYSLSAADGRLAWRFQAAPQDARLVAFGRLESPWPVHGSLLVLDDKIFCVAGRSMHLNGGLHVTALDAETGKVLQQTRLEADPAPKGELEGAMLPDILVSDGSGLYMRSMRFDPADITKHEIKKGGQYLLANDGGLLDGTWLNSTFWRYGKASAQMLVFDDKGAYGVKANQKLITKSYGHDVFTAGEGKMQLAAMGTSAMAAGAAKRRGKKTPKAKGLWTAPIAIRVLAMVLTNDHIVLAGSPDVIDERDPWKAYDGRSHGMVAVYARRDGEKVAEMVVDAPPVYDGLAAAGGRLYVSTADGSVVCLGGE